MAEKISVLYVEDDPRDQELPVRHLKKEAPHLIETDFGTRDVGGFLNGQETNV